MIIFITNSGDLDLREPDDFKNFKILLEARRHAGERRRSRAERRRATVDADGKTAWVSQAALKRWKGQAQSAAWVASFDKMIDSVKRFGWVDEAKATVRGHIEAAA